MSDYRDKHVELMRRLVRIQRALLCHGQLTPEEYRELLAIQVQAAHLRDQLEAEARDCRG